MEDISVTNNIFLLGDEVLNRRICFSHSFESFFFDQNFNFKLFEERDFDDEDSNFKLMEETDSEDEDSNFKLMDESDSDEDSNFKLRQETDDSSNENEMDEEMTQSSTELSTQSFKPSTNDTVNVWLDNAANSQSRDYKKKVSVQIYSPGIGRIPFTTIDDEYMNVSKKDIEKIIDQKYLPIPDDDPVYGAIVPIDQGIVYQPPEEDLVEKEYDSESDDELKTSYTTVGHFYLIK